MKEFIEKLIGRLEEKSDDIPIQYEDNYEKGFDDGIGYAIEIVNELAEEYNNDFCEWEYDEFETKWQTDCGVLFALHDSDREITQYCPYCGKKIKVAPYQPKGE